MSFVLHCTSTTMSPICAWQVRLLNSRICTACCRAHLLMACPISASSFCAAEGKPDYSVLARGIDRFWLQYLGGGFLTKAGITTDRLKGFVMAEGAVCFVLRRASQCVTGGRHSAVWMRPLQTRRRASSKPLLRSPIRASRTGGRSGL
jgi:hypothetical protein